MRNSRPYFFEAKTITKLSEYMHTAEAAEYLGVHHNTVRKWAARGEIPMHRNPVNGYRLFKRTDYDKFENDLLEDLLRVFDSETLRTDSGDVFGRIYEYFLMKFAGVKDIHTELADLNKEAVALAAKIQENFEGMGI